MNTRVETHTRPAIVHLVLQQRNASEGNANRASQVTKTYRELFDGLFDIIETHKAMVDHLSKEIKRWAFAFLEIDDIILENRDKAEQNSGVLQIEVVKLIHQLREEILVNPLDPKHPTLQDPYIEGDWVWEKSSLDIFNKVSKVSPYTFTPIVAEEHQFAKAMIVWLNSLVDTSGLGRDLVPLTQDSSISIQGETNAELAAVICITYYQCAQNAILIRANKMKERFQQEAILREARLKEDIDARIERLKIEERAAREVGEQIILQNLHALREENVAQQQIHLSRINILEQIADSQTTQLRCASEINVYNEQRLAQQQNYINDLNNRLNEVTQSLSQSGKKKKKFGIF